MDPRAGFRPSCCAPRAAIEPRILRSIVPAQEHVILSVQLGGATPQPSWRFPRQTAFSDDFPLCLQGPPPSKEQILFIFIVSPSLNCSETLVTKSCTLCFSIFHKLFKPHCGTAVRPETSQNVQLQTRHFVEFLVHNVKFRASQQVWQFQKLLHLIEKEKPVCAPDFVEGPHQGLNNAKASGSIF